jgi:hypothetical protein
MMAAESSTLSVKPAMRRKADFSLSVIMPPFVKFREKVSFYKNSTQIFFSQYGKC